MNKYDEWWASLTVAQKIRIASKALSKAFGHEVEAAYPDCTEYWNAFTDEQKQRIYNHCVDDHGLLRPDWQEGKMFSE